MHCQQLQHSTLLVGSCSTHEGGHPIIICQQNTVRDARVVSLNDSSWAGESVRGLACRGEDGEAGLSRGYEFEHVHRFICAVVQILYLAVIVF